MLCRRLLAVGGCAAKLELSHSHVVASQITVFSHGYFRVEDIVDAECQVCHALAWRGRLRRRRPRPPRTRGCRRGCRPPRSTVARTGGHGALPVRAPSARRVVLPPASLLVRRCRAADRATNLLGGPQAPHICHDLVHHGLCLPWPRPPVASSPVGLVRRGPRLPLDARTIALLEEKENNNSSK